MLIETPPLLADINKNTKLSSLRKFVLRKWETATGAANEDLGSEQPHAVSCIDVRY